MPKTYKEMLNALLDMKESGRFNKEHVDEILDTIADGVDYGVDNEEDVLMAKIAMVGRFHEGLGIYAIPSWKWLRPFAKMLEGKKVLEFGAGTGILTAAMRRLGVNIDAVDSQKKAWRHIPCLLEDIKVCDGLEYLKAHEKDYDVLFLAWPYMDDTCRLACKAFGEKKEIYYFGEDQLWEDMCGCTANMAFFSEFDLEMVDVEYNPLWDLRDFLYRVFPKRGA